MKASVAPAQPRAAAKSASPGRRKKAKAPVKERRASPPTPGKAPATPPSAAVQRTSDGAAPNHWAMSAFQNSPDPKLLPLPDFDLDFEAPVPQVAIEQTASLRRILNLA